MYDDEEEDFGLCRRCVRPHRPFRLWEDIDVRPVEVEEFQPGRIIAVYNHFRDVDDDEEEDFFYDVRTQDGYILEGMSALNLRRFR